MKSNKEYSLTDFLEIENSIEILEYKFSNSNNLMWPVIRVIVLRSLLDQLVLKSGKLVENTSTKSGRFKRLYCGLKSILHNIKFLTRSPNILFINSGITNILIAG